MSKNVKILADSTCDLSQDLIEKYDIDILPLHIVLGEEEFLDGKNITPDEIFVWSDEHNTTPKTSAASYEDAQVIMKPYIDNGQEIVFFCISEDMSTTANVLRMAAEDLGAEEQVFVVNSWNLSTGIGLQVIEAAIMAQAGKSGKEIASAVEELKKKVRASFVVDTLTYLYRGGRCSGLAALAGGMLKLHPKIVVKEGVMGADKKYRGKISVAIKAYAKDLEEELLTAKKDRVFITHSGCDREIVDSVRVYLESLNHFDEILETRAGGVISSHCGPGTLGILFIYE